MILSKFTNKDPEFKGFAAFYTILAKIRASKSRNYWSYIIKNLAILDRVVNEKHFGKEVSELETPEIEEYKALIKLHGNANPPQKPPLINFAHPFLEEEKIDTLIKRYFRYIKAKGRIYSTKHLPMTLSSDQQKKVINEIDHEKLIQEAKRLKSLFIFGLDVPKKIVSSQSKTNANF